MFTIFQCPICKVFFEKVGYAETAVCPICDSKEVILVKSPDDSIKDDCPDGNCKL